MQSTTTRDNAQTVKVFSPRDNVPAALADMTNDAVWQHIQHARRLIEHHEDIARNGDEAQPFTIFSFPKWHKTLPTPAIRLPFVLPKSDAARPTKRTPHRPHP